MSLNWSENGLLNKKRFSHKDSAKQASPGAEQVPTLSWILKENIRTEFERDYDRILFSTPVRRLGDKTQVFPLEKNVSIRTRLTHSYEVSNLARSMGTYIINGKYGENFGENSHRSIPAILGAAGLAHDIGNPPFGHSGEASIASWFKKHECTIFKGRDNKELTENQKHDFLNFEGNAQTIRILTRLQHIGQKHGLKLTYATIAALLKYPESSATHIGEKNKYHKFGYFQSEKNLIEEIYDETGLSESVRHPLTFIMEACDDIAYTILDAEDAVKKQVASYSDLIAWIGTKAKGDEATEYVIKSAQKDYAEYSGLSFSPSELNDVSMQKFRVHAINMMISAATNAFNDNYEKIMRGDFTDNLIEISTANKFGKALKSFDKEHAYRSTGVLDLESQGAKVIHGLMDFLWIGINDRTKDSFDSRRSCPFSIYAYNRISGNYRRVFEQRTRERPLYPELPERYYELQLLTDMVSGMADNFAIELYQDLERLYPKEYYERKSH